MNHGDATPISDSPKLIRVDLAERHAAGVDSECGLNKECGVPGIPSSPCAAMGPVMLELRELRGHLTYIGESEAD